MHQTEQGIQKVGIIGSSYQAFSLIQELQKMGKTCLLLTRQSEGKAAKLADICFDANNMKDIVAFALESQKVVLIDDEINLEVVQNLTQLVDFSQNFQLYQAKFNSQLKINICTNPYLPLAIYQPISSLEDFHHLIDKLGLPLEIRYGTSKRVVTNETAIKQMEDLLRTTVLYVRKKHFPKRYLTVAIIPSSEGTPFLGATEVRYHHGEISEMVNPAVISADLHDKVLASANYIAQNLNLNEIFFLDLIILEDETCLIRNIRQGIVEEFDFTEAAWRHSIYSYVAKQALDLFISIPEFTRYNPKSYSNWLKGEDLKKIEQMMPYFPEFQLDHRGKTDAALLTLTDPHLVDQLQKFYKILQQDQ